MKTITSGSIDHPHDFMVSRPDRPPSQSLRPLAELSPSRTVFAIANQWILILLAVSISISIDNIFVYLVSVAFIGARQHALLVLGHDASHYVLFKNRYINDWAADLFLYWPMFLTVGSFRYYHEAHHKYLADERDGNRIMWNTHDKSGNLTPEWTYPKPLHELVRILVYRSLFITGLKWIVQGMAAPFVASHFRKNSWLYVLARMSYYSILLTSIIFFQELPTFILYWIVPYCTWHILSQYLRLICEHSAMPDSPSPYNLTRTTIPNFFESIFILPCSIGYHHEHHWYPSVPHYNLARLHKLLKEETAMGKYGTYNNGLLSSLASCLEIPRHCQ